MTTQQLDRLIQELRLMLDECNDQQERKELTWLVSVLKYLVIDKVIPEL